MITELTQTEVRDYENPELLEIWKKFLEQLPENLKEEASKQKFTLNIIIEIEYTEDIPLSYIPYKFEIANCSKELQKALDKFIFLVKGF